MRDLNKIILIGRLGADPILKETPNGTKVVQFPLATSRRLKQTEDKTEVEEQTQWHRVYAWGKQAENCAQYLKKGRSIYLEGSVKMKKYDTKEGLTRFSFEVHAEDIIFLGSKPAMAKKVDGLSDEDAIDQIHQIELDQEIKEITRAS